MKIDPITAGVAVVALIFVIWLITKITRSIKPMSEQEAIQHGIAKRVEEQPPARGSKRSGCGWLILIIIIILVFSWLWLGKGFHP